MDLKDFKLGSIGDVDVALSGGALVVTLKIQAQAEIDALLGALAAKDPAIAPFVKLVQGVIDSSLV